MMRYVWGFMIGVLAAAVSGLYLIPKLVSGPTPEEVPIVKSWKLPSCPMELTLQDGSRWAMPAWSEPACQSVILWQVDRVPAQQLP